MSPVPDTKVLVPAGSAGHFPVTFALSRILPSLHFNKPLLPGVTNFIAGMNTAQTDKGVFKTIALKTIASQSQIRYMCLVSSTL